MAPCSSLDLGLAFLERKVCGADILTFNVEVGQPCVQTPSEAVVHRVGGACRAVALQTRPKIGKVLSSTIVTK